jgi:hypothetical protein
MCFPRSPAVDETCNTYSTTETKAKCWTLSRDKAVEEELCEGELSAKIKAIVKDSYNTLFNP